MAKLSSSSSTLPMPNDPKNNKHIAQIPSSRNFDTAPNKEHPPGQQHPFTKAIDLSTLQIRATQQPSDSLSLRQPNEMCAASEQSPQSMSDDVSHTLDKEQRTHDIARAMLLVNEKDKLANAMLEETRKRINRIKIRLANAELANKDFPRVKGDDIETTDNLVEAMSLQQKRVKFNPKTQIRAEGVEGRDLLVFKRSSPLYQPGEHAGYHLDTSGFKSSFESFYLHPDEAEDDTTGDKMMVDEDTSR